MLATFAFDVCHDVYLAAREAIETKIPTLNAESSGKYQWRPDRMPRLAEYVCDFARAGERALGFTRADLRLPLFSREGYTGAQVEDSRTVTTIVSATGMEGRPSRGAFGEGASENSFRTSASQGTPKARRSENTFRASPSERPFRASRMAMFRVYYLGGANYAAARRHLGISEFTWADWAEEIRRLVGRELTRSGVFPPSRYFRETTKKAS